MNPLGIIKGVTDFAVSVSVAAIVGNMIKATMPAQAKVISKIAYGVGGVVVAGMVGDYASKYANSQIDVVAKSISDIKTATSELKNELKKDKPTSFLTEQ